MSLKYSLQVVWSEEDKAFIATIPELPGCMADGDTPEAAVAAAYESAAHWIESATEMARAIPPAFTTEDYQRMAAQFRSKIQEEVKRQVEEAVSRVLNEISRVNPMLAGVGKDEADYWKHC
jgi:predicted RNase H-like HicB family nuclease